MSVESRNSITYDGYIEQNQFLGNIVELQNLVKSSKAV